ADYRNPFNGKTHRVSLLPEDVRAYVFWTRNAAPLLPHLSLIEDAGVPYYFLYTLTGYPSFLERGVPPPEQALRVIGRLARRIGPARVRWRYDPIVLSEETDAAFHLRNFTALAAALEGLTEVCIISFLDFYGKVKRNLRPLMEAGRLTLDSREVCAELAAELAGLGARHGIRVLACCEDEVVEGAVGKARCVDPDLIAALAPAGGGLPIRPSRAACGCAASRDIGAYDTCPHGCLYCYANASPEAAIRRYRQRAPERACL
ncbi:MAG: DUF1848 domain-containing protein, partial [bacterium]|nr:DUF1848 domain-containing protein [bacterium]